MNSDHFKLKTHLQDGFCISSLKLPFASEIVKKPVKVFILNYPKMMIFFCIL